TGATADIAGLTRLDSVSIAAPGDGVYYDIEGNGTTPPLTLTGTLSQTGSAPDAPNQWWIDLTLSATTHFQVASGKLLLLGKVAGDAGLTLDAGDGVLVLSFNGGLLTYTGDTTIEGNLRLQHADGLPFGGGAGDVHIGAGGSLDLNRYSQTVNGLSGSGFVGNVSTYSWAGNALTVGDDDASSEFLGQIGATEAGAPVDEMRLTKIGAGTFTMSGAGGWLQGTTIEEGWVALGSDAALPAGVDVAIENSSDPYDDRAAGLDLDGCKATVGDLIGNGTVDNLGKGDARLTMGIEDDGEFSGIITDQSGDDGALLSLTKVGGGTFTLSGACTYGGATTVSEGTLEAVAATAVPADSDLSISADATYSCDFYKRSTATMAGTISGPSGSTLHVGQYTTLTLNGSSPAFDGTSVVDGSGLDLGVLHVAAGMTLGGALEGAGAVGGNGEIAGFGSVAYVFPGIHGWQPGPGKKYFPVIEVSTLHSAATTWASGQVLGVAMTDATGDAVTYGLLRREQAGSVSECIFDAYRLTYLHEDMYHPLRIAELNTSGAMISV
ncbi:MAG: autotransporter-associated beta strand repeat-containing protein, partial [Actinomycetes bacterium]